MKVERHIELLHSSPEGAVLREIVAGDRVSAPGSDARGAYLVLMAWVMFNDHARCQPPGFALTSETNLGSLPTTWLMSAPPCDDSYCPIPVAEFTSF
jgi:hypothetical protein